LNQRYWKIYVILFSRQHVLLVQYRFFTVNFNKDGIFEYLDGVFQNLSGATSFSIMHRNQFTSIIASHEAKTPYGNMNNRKSTGSILGTRKRTLLTPAVLSSFQNKTSALLPRRSLAVHPTSYEISKRNTNPTTTRNTKGSRSGNANGRKWSLHDTQCHRQITARMVLARRLSRMRAH
jgi:hypothetical protein